MSAPTWLVARRMRGDEPGAAAGEWRVTPDTLTEDEARNRSRYFDEVLGCRLIAVDLDSLEAHLRDRS